MRTHTMLVCGLLLVAGALRCAGATEAAETQKEEPRRMNVFGLGGLYPALESHADVYLCTVVKLEPSVKESDGPIKRGVVTLSIDKVVLGKERKSLVLPYSYGFSKDGALAWTDLENAGKGQLLCVVVPDAEDVTAPALAGSREAAWRVLALGKERADEEAQATLQACALYEIRDTPQYVPALEKVMSGAGPVPRELQYFAAWALLKPQKNAGAQQEVMKFIQGCAASYTEGTDTKRAKVWSSTAESMAFRGGAGTEEEIRWQCRCLVALLQSGSKEVRRAVLNDFAHYAGWKLSDSKLRLEALLPEAEKETLRKSLSQAESDFKDKETLADILKISSQLKREKEISR